MTKFNLIDHQTKVQTELEIDRSDIKCGYTYEKDTVITAILKNEDVIFENNLFKPGYEKYDEFRNMVNEVSHRFS